jgi:hypothetical protein
MIFGITLKKFERLKDKPEVKLNFFTRWQFGRTKIKRYKFNNIRDLSFDKFIDCENFIENEQFKEFCSIFVKRKFWQTIYLHELETIVLDYARQKKELIDENDFIFNPPQYGEPAKETIGSELRREFVERYGNYVILMDVVCKGDMTKYKSVEQWKVRDFFFWANYLKGQRIVENVK